MKEDEDINERYRDNGAESGVKLRVDCISE